MLDQSKSANEKIPAHYKPKGAEEPHWDRMWRMYREAWFVGNVTKYIERYRSKNGIQDLLKAQHYLQKLIELERADEASKILAPTYQAEPTRQIDECSHEWEDFTLMNTIPPEHIRQCVRCFARGPSPKPATNPER